MRQSTSFPYVALAILAFALGSTAEYFFFGGQGPLGRYYRLIFLIWCSPIFVFWILKLSKKIPFSPNPWGLGLGLLFTVAGQLGELNTSKYVGLACALSAFSPAHFFQIPWVCTSISWMPALAWFSNYYFPGYLVESRFLLSICFSLPLIYIYVKKDYCNE